MADGVSIVDDGDTTDHNIFDIMEKESPTKAEDVSTDNTENGARELPVSSPTNVGKNIQFIDGQQQHAHVAKQTSQNTTSPVKTIQLSPLCIPSERTSDSCVSPDAPQKRRRIQHDYRRLSSSGYADDYRSGKRERFSSTATDESSEASISPPTPKVKPLKLKVPLVYTDLAANGSMEGFSPHKDTDKRSPGMGNDQKRKHRHRREHRDYKRLDTMLTTDDQCRKDKLKARHDRQLHHSERDGKVTRAVEKQAIAPVDIDIRCPKREAPDVQTECKNSVSNMDGLPSQKVDTNKSEGVQCEPANAGIVKLPSETAPVVDGSVSTSIAPTTEAKVDLIGAIGEPSETSRVSTHDDEHKTKRICQNIEAPDPKLGEQEDKENKNRGQECAGGMYSGEIVKNRGQECAGGMYSGEIVKNRGQECAGGMYSGETVKNRGQECTGGMYSGETVKNRGNNCNSSVKCPLDAGKTTSTSANVEQTSAKSPKTVVGDTKKGCNVSSKQKSRKRHKSDTSNYGEAKRKRHSTDHVSSRHRTTKESGTKESREDSKRVQPQVSRSVSLDGLSEKEAPKTAERIDDRLAHSSVCDAVTKVECEHSRGDVTLQGPGEHSYHRDPKSEPRHRHHSSSKHKEKSSSKHEHHHRHHRHERHHSSGSKSSGSTKSHNSSTSGGRKKVEKLTINCNSQGAVTVSDTNRSSQQKSCSVNSKSPSESKLPSSHNDISCESKSSVHKSGSTTTTHLKSSKTPSSDSKRVPDVNPLKDCSSRNGVKNCLTKVSNGDKIKKEIPESGPSQTKHVQKLTVPPRKHPLPNGDASVSRKKLNFEEALLSSDNSVVLAKNSTAVTPKKTKHAATTNVTPSKEKPAAKHSGTPKKRITSDLEANPDKYLHPKRIHDVGVQSHLDYVLRHQKYLTVKSPFADYKYGHLLHRERDPNGGAWVLHAYSDELSELSALDMQQFVDDYFKVAFSEDADGASIYTIAIVHGAAADLPDPLEYLALKHPNLIVKIGAFGRLEIDTMRVAQFRENVHGSYCAGTHHAGGMQHISLVGVKQEETGDYLAEFLDLMERCPFIRSVMPWGTLSTLDDMPRDHSNDGPILWNRPGEQLVLPVDSSKSPFKRKSRGINELKNLQYLPRASTIREQMIEDRTKAHADHVGYGPDRLTTAAVGILKAVHCGQDNTDDRIVKDVVCWAASDFDKVAAIMKLDLHEPPMSQTVLWADEAKLNQMRREGIHYSCVKLYDNDIYFIPRNTIHQFRSVSAVTSIAWHIRLKSYYPPPKDPAQNVDADSYVVNKTD